jgi:hypothetical protein
MPRSFKVLLPARIRTPSRPGGRSEADTLMGFFVSPGLFPRVVASGFPDPSLLRPGEPSPRRWIERRYRALPTSR